MKRNVLIMLILLVIAMFIVGCAEELPAEEGFEGDSGALAGQASFSPVDSCDKSPDADSSVFVKGSLTFTRYGKDYGPYTDRCYKGKIVEYYCNSGRSGNTISRSWLACENGCDIAAGTCVQAEICDGVDNDGDGWVDKTVVTVDGKVVLNEEEYYNYANQGIEMIVTAYCTTNENCGGFEQDCGINSYCLVNSDSTNGANCACDNGWKNCQDNDGSLACDNYIATDSNNCGACGVVCESGTCVDSVCVESPNCEQGQATGEITCKKPYGYWLAYTEYYNQSCSTYETDQYCGPTENYCLEGTGCCNIGQIDTYCDGDNFVNLTSSSCFPGEEFEIPKDCRPLYENNGTCYEAGEGFNSYYQKPLCKECGIPICEANGTMKKFGWISDGVPKCDTNSGWEMVGEIAGAGCP
ncbi:hypothetical protein HOE37_03820 [Candidatus Woesearchaeota archaeon]|nr:hypothetical protein [Candidatus Woesearchaeota archaeon]MBT4110959.1 hypothetical protein [Candidatus Woesearchaeota archaeon]MBT4336529.1 hypothetical protein [Candidatus Woesearchaeota archaeon]MBT4469722.1 hypothetical protein [Candidatus Woesearchaeota archaeon]MBT6744084.1 hypothetical protein [Candidatus Woesearchaeota archaeon]